MRKHKYVVAAYERGYGGGESCLHVVGVCDTWAVSEDQALNQARYRLLGNVSTHRPYGDDDSWTDYSVADVTDTAALVYGLWIGGADREYAIANAAQYDGVDERIVRASLQHMIKAERRLVQRGQIEQRLKAEADS